jgi:hypothetical protein
MKKNIRLLKSMPVIVWVCLLFLMFEVVLKIAGCAAATRAAEMEYEYYDIGYNYRTSMIEGRTLSPELIEVYRSIIETDRMFVEEHPEYKDLFDKRYQPILKAIENKGNSKAQG